MADISHHHHPALLALTGPDYPDCFAHKRHVAWSQADGSGHHDDHTAAARLIWLGGESFGHLLAAACANRFKIAYASLKLA
jgi:hypothetical protein